VATHSNACAVALTARNLTDAQLKAVGETDGMVGLNFGTMFLRPDGKRAPEGGIDFAIRHLAHMVEMAGEDMSASAPISTARRCPRGWARPRSCRRSWKRCAEAGFGEDLIRGICHGQLDRVPGPAFARYWTDLTKGTTDP
jgi:membrane dipeptidase